MKIGFVEHNPLVRPISFNRYTKAVFKQHLEYIPVWNSASLGLLTMAALVPAGWEVIYISSFQAAMKREDEFDIIAIGGVTHQADSIYRIA